jgi:hypothetical protein
LLSPIFHRTVTPEELVETMHRDASSSLDVRTFAGMRGRDPGRLLRGLRFHGSLRYAAPGALTDSRRESCAKKNSAQMKVSEGVKNLMTHTINSRRCSALITMTSSQDAAEYRSVSWALLAATCRYSSQSVRTSCSRSGLELPSAVSRSGRPNRESRLSSAAQLLIETPQEVAKISEEI